MIFRQKNRGFTLLEILVSIALFAIVGAALASSMSQMNKLTKKLRVKEATVLSAQIALDRIQRDFQMAYNERLQRSPTLFKASSVGTGPDIVFSFFESDLKTLFEKRTPGVALAHYSTEKADDGSLKIMRAAGPLYLGDKIKDEPGSVLATGILDWKLEFYDLKNDLWQTDWDTNAPSTVGAFPRAVRVQIKAVNPDWPKDEWKSKALVLMTEFSILNESETTQ